MVLLKMIGQIEQIARCDDGLSGDDECTKLQRRKVVVDRRSCVDIARTKAAVVGIVLFQKQAVVYKSSQ